ncbi:uncharacterized protein METZ01_LOCUS421169, partial [marine metagenome]
MVSLFHETIQSVFHAAVSDYLSRASPATIQ